MAIFTSGKALRHFSIKASTSELFSPFSKTVGSITFNDSEERFKCFGTDGAHALEAWKSVEILFFDSTESFAVKLKTNEGEEVILYKTTGEGKSFEENYKELLSKEKNYTESKEFGENDVLRVPYIEIHDEVNYDELCGKEIKGAGLYIKQALQTIDFELTNFGGCVKSEAYVDGTLRGLINTERRMVFNSDFILYLKEKNKDQPYFALKVDNTDVLVLEENSIN